MTIPPTEKRKPKFFVKKTHSENLYLEFHIVISIRSPTI